MNLQPNGDRPVTLTPATDYLRRGFLRRALDRLAGPALLFGLPAASTVLVAWLVGVWLGEIAGILAGVVVVIGWWGVALVLAAGERRR